MKKFLLHALFTTFALPIAINAADLPDATIYSGIAGKYMCSEYGVQAVDFQYIVNGEAQVIDFVDMQIGYEAWDTDMENPIFYTDVELIAPEGNSQTVRASIYTPSGFDILTTRTRSEETEGTTVSVALNSLEDYEWVDGEYSISIPANSFKSENGDVNPAQEISWIMLSSYAYCPDSNISPQPADGDQISGVYTQDQLKAVTLSFDGPVVYNAGEITYGDKNTVLPAENIKFDGNNLVLDLSFLEQGTYGFDIPSGYLIVDGKYFFGGKNFTFTVWNGLPVGQMIQGPAARSQYVNNIELYYGQEISAVGELPALNVYEDWYWEGATPAFTIPASNLSVKEVYFEPEDEDAEPESISVLYIDIVFEFFNKIGTFIIEIPEGIVQNNENQVNPAQQIQFTLAHLAEDPSGSMSDKVVYLIWEGATYVSVNEDVTPSVILPDGTREDLTWNDWLNPDGQISEVETYNGIAVNLSEIIATAGNGNYELVIPEAYLNIEIDGTGYINNEVVYPFTVSNGTTEIETIQPSNDVETIYNLNGMKVDRNRITNGIYIINGKKVMIRK